MNDKELNLIQGILSLSVGLTKEELKRDLKYISDRFGLNRDNIPEQFVISGFEKPKASVESSNAPVPETPVELSDTPVDVPETPEKKIDSLLQEVVSFLKRESKHGSKYLAIIAYLQLRGITASTRAITEFLKECEVAGAANAAMVNYGLINRGLITSKSINDPNSKKKRNESFVTLKGLDFLKENGLDIHSNAAGDIPKAAAEPKSELPELLKYLKKVSSFGRKYLAIIAYLQSLRIIPTTREISKFVKEHNIVAAANATTVKYGLVKKDLIISQPIKGLAKKQARLKYFVTQKGMANLKQAGLDFNGDGLHG